MARPGAKPKPTALLDLHGTRRPSRHGTKEDDVVAVGKVDPMDAPKWFSAEAKASWEYALANAPLGVVKAIDRALLKIFCEAEARYDRAMERQNEIDKSATLPMLTKGHRGVPMISPYLKIATQASEIMMRAASELGFTPASRPRLSAPQPPDMRPSATGQSRRQGDDFDAFLRSRPGAKASDGSRPN